MRWRIPSWYSLERKTRDRILVGFVTILVAGVLGGLTTHDDIGWRQMTGIALAISFYAIFALGLSLEFGYTGLLNLGHVGFMAIGAYTYGVLLMSGGRPTDAAPVVGWLYDQAPHFQGSTPLGFALCALVALLAGALVLVPLLLTVENAARDVSPTMGRRRLARDLLIGLATGAAGFGVCAAVLAAHPGGKGNVVASLLLVAYFAGAVALLVGALMSLRALVRLAIAHTPLRDAVRARTLLVVAIALVVAALVFRNAWPLGAAGAIAVAVLLSVLLGVVIAAFVALVLGLPAIRLREDYLAIVTLGFSEILRSVIQNEPRWTRGTQPIQSFPRPIASWASDTEWWRELAGRIGVRGGDLALLAVSVLVLAYAYVLLRALSDSPWGRVLRAIREDEEAVSALGKNVTWFKLQALMLGSAIAAVAGVIFVSEKALVAPGQFLPIVTFYAFIIVVLGGIGNHRGALVGSVILWGLFFGAQNAGLEQIGIEAGPAQLIFVGVVLILVMMFRPQGLVGRKEELLFAK